MTLTTAIAKARTSSRANRHRQLLAELRIDENVLAQDIHRSHDRFWSEDSKGDDAFEETLAVAARLLRDEVIDPDAMRSALADIYIVRQRGEKREEDRIREADSTTVTLIDLQQRNNPAFIEGQFVPAGSDGAA